MRPEEAVAKIKAVIEDYRKTGIPADLIEAARRRELAEAQLQRNSIQGLALEWSQAVAVEGRRSPDEDLRALEKVTAADVDRVLRYFLDNQTATVAYAVPKNAGIVSSAESFIGPSQGPEQNVVIPTEHKPLPDWARKPLENLRVPSKTARPVAMTLSNGIKLIVQPEQITPTVVVAGLIKHDTGLQEPPGKEGVAALASDLLSYGTSHYDRLQYQAELDRIAASVETGMAFSLKVLSKDFDRGAQLLADAELHPAFAPNAFAVVKRKAYQNALGQEKAPGHLASVALSKALYPPGDPERRFATPHSVGKLALDDVKAWHRNAYRPDLATIVVIGDISPEAAKNSFERWFGAWNAIGPTPNVYPPTVANNRPAALFIPAASLIQDQVLLAENLGLLRTDPDRAPLEVANTLLGEGFYASLLFHDLREVSGYVYTVSTNLNIEKTRSQFAIAYGAMPQNVSKAAALAIADLRRLQTETWPDVRLQHAKALLLGKHVLKGQSYDGIAQQLLSYASEGLPLDQDLLDARAQLAVTPESLRSAVAKWIRPGSFVRLVVGPQPE
ncbi:MAG: insulinase family protein [Methylobacter sp.]